MPEKSSKSGPHALERPERNLREDILREALGIIETEGLERLSMREVARRLGVSHQAPYKHFASRDHILAEIVGRAFAAFALYLDARPPTGVAHEDMDHRGDAYLRYAAEHPLNYRLMFATPLPEPAKHPAMMQHARHAFSLLQDNVAHLHEQAGRQVTADSIALDALYIWATLHGLAGILHGHAVQTLGLAPELLARASEETRARVGGAFGLYPAPGSGG